MRAMFSTIAPRYDFITRAFSYGMDRRWKRALVDRARLPGNAVVLDLASGTGDFSVEVAAKHPGSKSIAVDLTDGTLADPLLIAVADLLLVSTDLPAPDGLPGLELCRIQPT